MKNLYTPSIQNNGFIALVSVLIVSALLIVIGLGTSLRGIDTTELSLSDSLSLQARHLADACAEEALMKLKSNFNYAGNEIIIVEGADACTIVSVLGSGNTNRVINVEAYVNGYKKKVVVDVASLLPIPVIRSWVEVGDF